MDTQMQQQESRQEGRQERQQEGRCEHCNQPVDQRATVREQKLKNKLMARLNRVEGQIRGIKGMIENDAYCDDVLAQVAAAQAALGSIAKLILEQHVRACVVDKIKQDDQDIIDELMTTIGRML